MAAYAALVSLAKTTNLLLNSDKHSISVDEKAQITSIREYVMFLVSFLEEFPEKSTSRLEGKIRFEFEHQLSKVKEEIGLIVGELMDEPFVTDSAAVSSPKLADIIENDVVIGLADDLITIKDRLCGESSKLEFIPIVGMGGIGKTTLARSAYDDQLIVENFHFRAWVTILEDYSVKRTLSRLVNLLKLFLGEQVKDGEIDGYVVETSLDECEMERKVYQRLKGRRYLVVMDDIWSTKVWDDVRDIFPDDGNGSHIMLTTRLADVGVYAGSSCSLHRMRYMDKDQSWHLVRHKVFTDGQDCPFELEDMGKEIAQRCGGLPLAVVGCPNWRNLVCR